LLFDGNSVLISYCD